MAGNLSRCKGYLNELMRDRGIIIKEIIMVPGTKAKTMTNNLPLLTVLADVVLHGIVIIYAVTILHKRHQPRI
jgi:hypothetical protein